ncbi:RT0821/Lpp0805 family surface protein [Mangrovicella endophytica]|uniref:RT0821/Lpp0805 family surface protein n=1 Tax=Mangrovicella endophytica TaxID=2066697 RepID=UPI001300119D|nr:RT0821/Lpp0805 family surface protein [Mangrovicella endophytica]
MDDLVDHSIQTGSISAPADQTPPDQLSDQRTVRNAVSAAALADVGSLAWANADTGASGVITAIREVRDGNNICRSFKTSRQRFDGIALYNGEACTKGEGQWTLTRFNEEG